MVGKRNISKRETVTLNKVFTDIATAIRTKSGISESICPVEMGNQIRNLKGIPSVQLDSVTLQTVFQDIADAIRSCDVYGKMTPTQMP